MDSFVGTVSWVWNSDAFGCNPASYSIAIHLFLKLLGLIYVIAYIPLLFQIRGLLGKEGIRPIAPYLALIKERLGSRCYYYMPTLFWLNASDTALFALLWSGIALGCFLMLGLFPAPLLLLLLYIVHLSLTSAGQEFLGFGWETVLMEMTQATIILTATAPYNSFGWIALNFFLLRFHFQAGASKLLSNDRNWRNLTALSYHYVTQPLPNTQAWYFHKLPMWFHKASTVMMFFIELVVPFAIFSPPEIRFVVFILIFGLQVGIWFTGNLSYLNHLTAAFCVILLHNKFLEPFFAAPQVEAPSPFIWQCIISLLGFSLLVLELISFVHYLFPKHFSHKILVAIEPFHVAHPHGIFAIMTTKRYEIVIEGSADGVNWKEYNFYFKPGLLSWRPHRVAPYQPRLDWQAWFLPFRPYQVEWWFQAFLVRLLEGSKPVTKLLRYNPFEEKPPLYVRALMYDYEFTTMKEKNESGNWWKRRLVGIFAPSIRLRTQEEI
ncbi:MAG TPA: lipase maturation factor family protein, partial [Chlamydiales bacterium]|nr:lipase maturation factor family protein [Chlamydiales bacterium]